MDPREINPARLSRDEIWSIAERFREENIFNDTIPVNIEVVMQSTLGIHPIPTENLRRDCTLDGFISLDFKYIYVDEFQYSSDNYYKRVRFTMAHEIGHRVLHRDIIEKINFESEDEWKKFRMNLREESLLGFEWQASEFAGRLLVPLNKLVIEFKAARNEILKSNASWRASKIDNDELFSSVAPLIAPKFDVSTDVIEKRLDKENIMKFII